VTDPLTAAGSHLPARSGRPADADVPADKLIMDRMDAMEATAPLTADPQAFCWPLR
jgi:hypothetical protein